MKKLSFSINLIKIDKEKINVTENGKWLNGTIFINEEIDKYGSIGFMAQNPKDGKQGLILGQIKPIEQKLNNDDLPF
jgi:hypothetical protein